jgi:uncharacterized protein YggE
MLRLLFTVTLLAHFGVRSSAQTPPLRPFIRASGQASVFVPPDQAKVGASVMTQGTTAQDAASRNADQVASLVTALTKLVGTGADIKTINYSVGPIYKSSQNGGPPTIVGYTASLTVQVTLGALSTVGAVIDTATQAGATSIGALQFSLKDSEPAHLQALRLATLQAKARADTIASGLGRTVGAVISIQEGTAISVQPIVAGTGAAPATPTTITPGLIEVQGSVVLDAELT